MPDAAFPLIPPNDTATFCHRGAAAPFTTPRLAGARVRRLRQANTELVLTNPSGARGVYVLPWTGVRALCQPTVHDTILFRRFEALGSVDPASIRQAALAVAAEGHAGREAMAAAQSAIEADHTQRARAHVLLLTKLVQRHDGRQSVSAEWSTDLERRATAVLHRIAPSLGVPAAQLAHSLVALGDLFAPVGVAADDHAARIPRLLLRLAATSTDMDRWPGNERTDDIDGLARTIVTAMRAACDIGAALLGAVRATLNDPAALLKRWLCDQAAVRASATRCDWVLDGWERVSLLWHMTGTATTRQNVLLEMAALIPNLPREVLGWTDIAIPAEAVEQTCRVTSHEDGWRTGVAALALIARNEKLIAMSA